MCHYSLSKGICRNADCKLRHVIGTKKISNETETIEKNRKKGTRDTTVGRDPINGGNLDAFLDMLNRIKAEMLETVDARVAQCISAQPQLPATGNGTRIGAPRMTMAGPASYMTQGIIILLQCRADNHGSCQRQYGQHIHKQVCIFLWETCPCHPNRGEQ